MIEKKFVHAGDRMVARVMFCLPDSMWVDSVCLVGDFNDWNGATHPMLPNRQGCPEINVDLEIGRAYQFRYLIDGHQWTNDPQADAFVHNFHGSDNFVVVTDPQFVQHRDPAPVGREPQKRRPAGTA
jgi:1,4-alpha-glucan branching enzyme